MDTRDLYKDSSGVDIDSVFEDYEASRAIGYDGEYALFDYLLKVDSRYDNSKILTNLEIPAITRGKTTEIDMMMICEYGIIVFEVKNYKGTIYGTHDEKYWTQYFRTANNQRFLNPIRQNEYHISALKELCNEKLFSVILFPNRDCDIRRVAFREGNFTVANLNSLDMEMGRIASMPKTIPPKRVEELFDEFKKYSKAKNSDDLYRATSYNSLEELRTELSNSVTARVAEATDEIKKKYAKKAARVRTRTTILCVVCVITTLIFARNFSNMEAQLTKERDEALAKYESMNEKFSVASEEDMAIARSILTVSELSFTPHDYYLDSYYLTFSITNNTNSLNIYFGGAGNKEADLYITLKDGSVVEFESKSENRYHANAAYRSGYAGWSNICKFVYEIPYSLDDIQTIKLSPLTLTASGKKDRIVSLTLYQAPSEGE